MGLGVHHLISVNVDKVNKAEFGSYIMMEKKFEKMEAMGYLASDDDKIAFVSGLKEAEIIKNCIFCIQFHL